MCLSLFCGGGRVPVPARRIPQGAGGALRLPAPSFGIISHFWPPGSLLWDYSPFLGSRLLPLGLFPIFGFLGPSFGIIPNSWAPSSYFWDYSQFLGSQLLPLGLFPTVVGEGSDDLNNPQPCTRMVWGGLRGLGCVKWSILGWSLEVWGLCLGRFL